MLQLETIGRLLFLLCMGKDMAGGSMSVNIGSFLQMIRNGSKSVKPSMQIRGTVEPQLCQRIFLTPHHRIRQHFYNHERSHSSLCSRRLNLDPGDFFRQQWPASGPNPAIKKDDKGVSYAYVRPLATIEPLAIRVGLPVIIDQSMTEITPLATKLLERKDGIQIVVWEHHWAEKLARQLLVSAGGNPDEVPRWSDADFDSLFVIRLSDGSSGNRQATFAQERQGLEHLSDLCPN